MRRFERGFFYLSASGYLMFLALVAVIGWALIEGAIWIVRFLIHHLAWIP